MNGIGDHKISDKIIIYGDDGMGYRERWQNSLQGSRWVTTHTTVESNHTSNTDFFCIKSWKNDGYENYFSSMGFLGQILLMNDLLYITTM